jgi:N-methylhydantoinase A
VSANPPSLGNLGADIGGTFTDVVLEISGGSFSAKVLTTYDAPERAIIEGMHRVCAKAGVAPAAIGRIIHGTTLATNALIERRGAKTALITTAGFRDVIEMRTESRFEQYDLNLVLPEPLLPRNRRYTLRERVGASGEILIPLARADVEKLAEDIAEARYESVAIGLIHSYPTLSTSARSATCSLNECRASPSRFPRKCRRRCANTSGSTRSRRTPTSNR